MERAFTMLDVLEAVRMSGNGAHAHKVDQLIGVIRVRMADVCDFPASEKCADELDAACERAKEFLVNLARETWSYAPKADNAA